MNTQQKQSLENAILSDNTDKKPFSRIFISSSQFWQCQDFDGAYSVNTSLSCFTLCLLTERLTINGHDPQKQPFKCFDMTSQNHNLNQVKSSSHLIMVFNHEIRQLFFPDRNQYDFKVLMQN